MIVFVTISTVKFWSMSSKNITFITCINNTFVTKPGKGIIYSKKSELCFRYISAFKVEPFVARVATNTVYIIRHLRLACWAETGHRGGGRGLEKVCVV